VITTLSKLTANDHTCFLKSQGKTCIGFIKVGYKKLFVRTRSNNLVEI
jgi:alpha-tubulin N-acetyltransferase 1